MRPGYAYIRVDSSEFVENGQGCLAREAPIGQRWLERVSLTIPCSIRM